MSKEQKAIMKKLRARFKAINDEFLSHFEKKFIVFIEEGTDLIKDLNLFDRQLKFNEENSADGIIKQLEDTKTAVRDMMVYQKYFYPMQMQAIIGENMMHCKAAVADQGYI